jgi:hypothetical protein
MSCASLRAVRPLGVLQLLLDAAFALLDRLDEDREPPTPQDEQQQPEDDERPNDQPGVDVERTRPGRLVRFLLKEEE